MSLHPQQIITRKDGIAVPAEELAIGDGLISPEGVARVTRLDRHKCPAWTEIFCSNKVSLLVAPEHVFINEAGNSVLASALILGQQLSGQQHPVSVEGLVRIPRGAQAVLIEVEGGIFYVQGILSRCVAK